MKLFKPKVVEKPWGKEVWIADEPEYGGKLLYLKRGYTTSLHYHEVKKETLYLFKGKARVTFVIGDERKVVELEEGDSLTIEPGDIHRIEAVTDIVLIEVSTQPLGERVRVEEYYGRGKTED